MKSSITESKLPLGFKSLVLLLAAFLSSNANAEYYWVESEPYVCAYGDCGPCARPCARRPRPCVKRHRVVRCKRRPVCRPVRVKPCKVIRPCRVRPPCRPMRACGNCGPIIEVYYVVQTRPTCGGPCAFPEPIEYRGPCGEMMVPAPPPCGGPPCGGPPPCAAPPYAGPPPCGGGCGGCGRPGQYRIYQNVPPPTYYEYEPPGCNYDLATGDDDPCCHPDMQIN